MQTEYTKDYMNERSYAVMSNKKNNSFYVFCRFLKIMGKPLPLFLFAMIIHMVGDNFFNITIALFAKNVVEMAQSKDISQFLNLLLWLLMAGLVSLLVFFIFGAIYDIEAKRGNAKVQRLVIEKALRMPMSYYDEHHSGEIVSKLLNDADAASQIFTSRLRRVTTPVMSVIVYFIPMIIMNYRLALCLLVVNVISLFVNGAFVEPMKKIGKETSQKKKNMTKDVSTVISGISTIKMYPGCNRLINNFKSDVTDYSVIKRKYVRAGSTLSGINAFFDMVCALGFLAVSVYFVNIGLADLGSVAAIYTLYGSFSYNFLELGKYLPELMNCIARAQVLFEFLEQEEEAGLAEYVAESVDKAEEAGEMCEMDKTHEGACVAAGQAVEFKNISFSYQYNNHNNKEEKGTPKLLYKNYNMAIPSGKSTAITGKSGAGKSTLFKLLLGFYPIISGEIKIAGKKLTSASIGSIRNQIAYIPQKSHLFNMSVKENIKLGNENASDEEIIEAARLANADDFIMGLPNGYDTILENGGNNLSGGEQQRLAIARAFVRKAPILLMDEATSSLDNENESQVQGAVAKIMKNRTAIIIAHRPATILACENRVEVIGSSDINSNFL